LDTGTLIFFELEDAFMKFFQWLILRRWLWNKKLY